LPGITTLSNVVMYVDLNCSEVPVSLPNNPLDLTGASFPIAPDWSFNVNLPYSDADGSINLSFSGKLSTPGSASGTLRVDLALNNVAGVGTVHCSTGDVTWNAS
jgi:hypothetical protein